MIDKEQGSERTHLSDALGYLMWQECQAAGEKMASRDERLLWDGGNFAEHQPESIRTTLRRRRCGGSIATFTPAASRSRRTQPEYLVQRQKEPGRRLRGTTEPGVLRKLCRVDYRLVRGDTVSAGAGDAVRRQQRRRRKFFNALVEDCDLKGTAPSRFLPAAVDRALVCGRSYIAVEFPKVGEPGDAGGRGRAWDIAGISGGLSAGQVINWSLDE